MLAPEVLGGAAAGALLAEEVEGDRVERDPGEGAEAQDSGEHAVRGRGRVRRERGGDVRSERAPRGREDEGRAVHPTNTAIHRTGHRTCDTHQPITGGVTNTAGKIFQK